MTAPEDKSGWCAIIPAYFEEEHIADVVRGVIGQGLRALVVDDGSTDTTAARAEAAGATVLRHPVNRGKGAALQTAFSHAMEQGRGMTWVVTMDADGQHDPADLPAFYNAATGDVAALVGNRMGDTTDMPALRRLTNRLMSWLLSCIIGCRIPDTQCGYRAYRVDVLPHLFTESARYEAESEALIRLGRAGVRIESVPIRTIYCAAPASKINPVTDTVRFFAMLQRLRRERRRELKNRSVATSRD